jgi:PAS domain S-box-containing protein
MESSTRPFNSSSLATDRQNFYTGGVGEKNRTFHNILAGAEEFILNPEGIIFSSNLEAVNVTGYEEWEVIGKNFSFLYLEDEIAKHRPSYDLQLAATEGQFTCTGYRVKKNGTRFLARITNRCVRDALGNISSYKVVIQDEMRCALSSFELKRLQQEYASIFQNSSFGIFKFDLANRRVVQFNQRAFDILRRNKELPFPLQDIFSSPFEYDRFVELFIKQDQIKNFEFKLNNAGQEEKWVCIDCTVFREDGFVEGILFDVTSYKNQIMQYNKLKENMDSFLYHTSHDLRAPLSSILGLTSLIKMDKPQEGVLHYANLIEDRVADLDNLLRDLSAIAYNSNSDPVFTEIDVQGYLEHIIKGFQKSFPGVDVSIQQDSECSFYSDNIRLHTILHNLIYNAFKFTNPSAEHAFVKILVSITADTMNLKVVDNGIGIDNRYLFQIFNMFNRSAAESKTGHGLGLYIVKMMVDTLGGSVHVTSRLGEGSEFLIAIPNKIRQYR